MKNSQQKGTDLFSFFFCSTTVTAKLVIIDLTT